MVATLVPARLELREDGTPFSRAYGDIYHSESGGLGQAEHVFLRGNDLPRRWAGRSLFSILETGFGLGINFLATWAQWRRDVEACTRLHYVSIEKHPFSKIDLQNYLTSVLRLLQVSGHTSDTPSLANEFPILVDALCAAWPPLVTGMHRIEFEQGRVVLTLIFGDALEVLPTLTMRADAFYLDGFSPAKNPDLWSTPVFKSLTRLAALGASVATYTVSAVVRQSLQDAGFRIDREPGYDSKRDMLIGRFVPRFRMRRYEPPAPFAEQFSNASKHVMVVGAGLAGCAVVATMAARGWHVTLIEAQAAAAMAASGNPAGVFHPMITRDDSFAARLSRSGFLHALRAWHSLQARGLQFELHDQGLFVAAQNAEDFAQMQIAHAALRLPDDYVRLLTPDAALSLIGVAPVHGGWYFPQGGWLDPAALCRAQLAAAGTHLTAHYNTLAHRIERQGGNWQVLDQDRHVIACAPILVIANAHDAGRLTSLQHLPTISIRGQLTQLPATQYSHPMQALQQPLIGDGYVIPLGSRGWLTGASYDFDDTDATLRLDSQQENLQRLRTLLPQAAAMLDSSDAAPPARRPYRISLCCLGSHALDRRGS